MTLVRSEKKPQSTCQRVTSLLQNAYLNSPLSTITGYRYPGIPRLLGNPFLGRFSSICESTGLGVGKDIELAADLARKHPRGMCYFWIANKFVLLVTNPKDIRQIMLYNENHLRRDDTAGNFRQAFGKSIFDLKNEDPELRQEREIFKRYLHENARLKTLSEPIQAILNDFISNKIKTESVDLEKLTTDLAMEIIGKTTLGLANIPD